MKKINKILGISLDDWYWSLKFGKSKRKAGIFELRDMLIGKIPPPVFFLSTGRCGTKWFSSLLDPLDELMVLHDPVPNLGIQGKVAYEEQVVHNFSLPENSRVLIQEIIWAGREQYFRYAYKSGRRIVETNNSITFFAPLLAEIFPEARFVHLYRHPGEFVRSAIRRNYYQPGNSEDLKRIAPAENDPIHEKWNEMDQLQKCAWLWNETNAFIDKTGDIIGEERFYKFNFNTLNIESVMPLLDFLDISFSENKIRKHLDIHENVQKTGTFPEFSRWSEQQKEYLKEQCGELAKKYGYRLT